MSAVKNGFVENGAMGRTLWKPLTLVSAREQDVDFLSDFAVNLDLWPSWKCQDQIF